jgi:Na+-transporting methylmalonyl-CoA/oxaloacetate decarboxylase gamma subunit
MNFDMETIQKATILMVTGMIVLFAFMASMIVILHYMIKIARKFAKTNNSV